MPFLFNMRLSQLRKSEETSKEIIYTPVPDENIETLKDADQIPLKEPQIIESDNVEATVLLDTADKVLNNENLVKNDAKVSLDTEFIKNRKINKIKK